MRRGDSERGWIDCTEGNNGQASSGACALRSLSHGCEESIGVVESAVLQLEHELGRLAHEEVEHVSGRGVVRAVEEFGFGHFTVAFLVENE